MTNDPRDSNDRLYTRRFFGMFAAVMLFMTGMALQFHFGQYIGYLGYSVTVLGWILAASMIGTLLIRLSIGRWIDRFGCRPTWLVGTGVIAVATGSIQFLSQTWHIALARAVSMMAAAAVLTTAAVFAAQIATHRRRAESIGSMGLAGLLGMIIGPLLGDWIFSGESNTITPYRIFFTASAICSLLAGLIVWATRPPVAGVGDDLGLAPSPTATLTARSQVRIILRHWPGIVLLVGLVFSMAFTVQSSFLERLAENRGFRDIKCFFLIYGPTAIVLRILCRRMPERFGRERTLILGCLLMAAGLGLLSKVETEAALLVPGCLMGAGHSLIFPSMVDLAAACFPPKYRGTGTSLILGAGDVGLLVGFAGLGPLIDAYGFTASITLMSACMLTAGVLFALVKRRIVLGRHPARGPQKKASER